MEQIIKYGNRKLYSKDQKKYLNLLDIYNRHKAGDPYTIKDKLTLQDITNSLTLQSIVFYSSEEECGNLINPFNQITTKGVV